ncbi:hypothetical protein KSP39_PZI021233 [Platanthera zijinensis]|uniref:Mitochondrial import inner membrane translocase subunit Tim21 n=1 Tax=Platanthera zijinensis TaxID=2320716 RepID=A0AAP0FVQ3_9ASPA
MQHVRRTPALFFLYPSPSHSRPPSHFLPILLCTTLYLLSIFGAAPLNILPCRVCASFQVKVRIGFPVIGYAQETKNRAARQKVSNRVWKDEDGIEHVEVVFFFSYYCSYNMDFILVFLDPSFGIDMIIHKTTLQIKVQCSFSLLFLNFS